MTATARIPGFSYAPGLRSGEVAVDLFAGGGGASRGIELATGISPAIAINHDPHAIQMHELNHPDTVHHCQSVHHRQVHPAELVRGFKVGLLWLSPDCRHFSRAKGKAPVSESVRGLAWIGLRWAKFARPRIVVLENVPEFLTWGPIRDGMPIAARAGETFRAFVREWHRYGYQVDWRTLCAADYGAPTTRKRLFFVARCDGEAIRWPAPSHGKSGKPRPWRTAAECIDWSIPCPSIFGRKRPLAPATCQRIARGIVRYVLTAAKPFIVRMGYGDKQWNGVDEPLSTVLAQGNHHALLAPTLIHTGNGEREGQAPRCQDLQAPMGTVVAQRSNGALVAAFLAKHNGGTTGQDLDQPLHTIAGHINKGLAAVHLTKFRQNSIGSDLADPMPTVTAGAGAARPAGAPHALGLVAAFLVQYYSSGTTDQPLDEPLATIVSRARHGLVTVTIDGCEYAIVDIGLRMLEPSELALAQGFEAGYQLTGTKAQRIARIGNSVCPPVAAAVVRAQLDEPAEAVA